MDRRSRPTRSRPLREFGGWLAVIALYAGATALASAVGRILAGSGP